MHLYYKEEEEEDVDMNLYKFSELFLFSKT